MPSFELTILSYIRISRFLRRKFFNLLSELLLYSSLSYIRISRFLRRKFFNLLSELLLYSLSYIRISRFLRRKFSISEPTLTL